MLFSLNGFQVNGHDHVFNCFDGFRCIPLIFVNKD